MKKTLIVVLTAFVMIFTTEALLAQAVTVKGSNTFGEELAPALIKAFNAKHGNITIDLESTSSGHGIDALLEGNCDIAASSRSLTDDEIRKAHSRNVKLDQHIVGYYGVAVIAHPANPVRALTDRQIERIFTGRITNWNEVGGNDAPINVIISGPTAGTHLGFRELAMGNKPYVEGAATQNTYTEISDAVAADVHAIGYVSINMSHGSSIRAIIVNGIHPSNIAVIEGLYPFARQVRVITNSDKYPRDARTFVQFIQSRDGQRVVEAVGFVPRFVSRMDMGGIAF